MFLVSESILKKILVLGVGVKFKCIGVCIH